MVKGRQYPHNHEDPITVGGKEVLFGSTGSGYLNGEVVVASEDHSRAVEILERFIGKRGEVYPGEPSAGIALIEYTANADPLAVVRRLESAA